MTDSEIIDALGGPTAVARLIEATPQAVSQWRRHGIPKARRQLLRLMRPELFGSVPGRTDGLFATTIVEGNGA